jgi:oxygen-independent coproporphyrinogen III oxidase
MPHERTPGIILRVGGGAMTFAVRFDPELVRRHDCFGPRYTSYPTAVQFHDGFGEREYRAAATASNAELGRPLSLYVHIPFCASPCFYCGCNKVVTRSSERADAYLERLYREIALQATLFDRGRPVEQLHFGGGTPTFLTHPQLQALVSALDRSFGLSSDPGREYSIEIDPRTVGRDTLALLRGLGFNRMSVGVQDCDPDVQRAVNRFQPAEETLQVIDDARALGFGSVSVDLIYGLPLQTLASFERTLDTVLTARPDRLAVYGYAHMPHLFKPQKRIKAEQLPSPETRLELLGLTITRLTDAGYVYIGMDHFALPGDELVRAQSDGHLQRNFQGYSTRAHCDLVGLGVSSISKIGRTYAQNAKTLPDYYATIESGRLPVQRGIELTDDDVLRREVIQTLMCHGHVDFTTIGQRFGIDFPAYFAPELERLQHFRNDGLVEFAADRIDATPAGRLLIRNVAMVFDAYLGAAPARPIFSKAI